MSRTWLAPSTISSHLASSMGVILHQIGCEDRVNPTLDVLRAGEDDETLIAIHVLGRHRRAGCVDVVDDEAGPDRLVGLKRTSKADTAAGDAVDLTERLQLRYDHRSEGRQIIPGERRAVDAEGINAARVQGEVAPLEHQVASTALYTSVASSYPTIT